MTEKFWEKVADGVNGILSRLGFLQILTLTVAVIFALYAAKHFFP